MTRYIDKDDLLVKIMDLNIDHVQGDDGRELCQVIQDLPTADVREVKHCHIVHDKDGWLSCSNCHILLPQLFDVYRFYYCPNCGAIMDEMDE